LHYGGGFPYNRPQLQSTVRCLTRGEQVRTFLGVIVIGVGIVNICFRHPWHRVLGVVAIAVGLLLCALVWWL